MIVDLPMYDWSAIRAETDAFWAEVARRLAACGIEAPARLARRSDYWEPWGSPVLLLGQTCGMPFVAGECGEARLIARPDYGLPAAHDGFYRSAIVVRAEDAAKTGPEAVLAQRGRRVAINGWSSYSGHIALRAHVAGLRNGAAAPFFGEAQVSGSHRASASLVAGGAADVAALDAVAWTLLSAHEPETAGRLAVIDLTAPAPALPYITAPRFAPIQTALVDALAGAAAARPAVVGLPRAVTAATEADYLPTRQAARRAAAEPLAPGAPAVPPV